MDSGSQDVAQFAGALGPAVTLGARALGIAVPAWQVGPGDGVEVPAALARGALSPEDAADPGAALDRWRRGTAIVLEAALAAARRAAPGAPPWAVAAVAARRLDVAVPELGLARADVRLARRTGDLARWPRAGHGLLAAVGAAGADVDALSADLLAGTMSMRALGEAAVALFGPAGARLARGGEVRAAVDVPAQLPPWQLAPVEVPSHARGGHVSARGPGGIAPAWAPAGKVLRAVAVSGPASLRLEPDCGGPVGTWWLRSAEGFGRILGARGLCFTFHASGRLDLVLADAFVGGLEALEVAARLGTSGTSSGRWTVAGPRRLALHDLEPGAATLHGRDADGASFALPAGDTGLAAGLRAMSDSAWTWTTDGAVLWLRGRLWGSEVALRLVAEVVDWDA